MVSVGESILRQHRCLVETRRGSVVIRRLLVVSYTLDVRWRRFRKQNGYSWRSGPCPSFNSSNMSLCPSPPGHMIRSSHDWVSGHGTYQTYGKDEKKASESDTPPVFTERRRSKGEGRGKEGRNPFRLCTSSTKVFRRSRTKSVVGDDWGPGSVERRVNCRSLHSSNLCEIWQSRNFFHSSSVHPLQTLLAVTSLNCFWPSESPKGRGRGDFGS